MLDVFDGFLLRNKPILLNYSRRSVRAGPLVSIISVARSDTFADRELRLDMSETAPAKAELQTTELPSSSSGQPVAVERRTESRRPINIGFHIVPLDRRGNPLYSVAFTATGKNISGGGLAVSHLKPMEYPRALITAMGTYADQFRIEAEVAWTGPTSNGVYETGFKITRKSI
jgi:hypothetical protein